MTAVAEQGSDRKWAVLHGAAHTSPPGSSLFGVSEPYLAAAGGTDAAIPAAGATSGRCSRLRYGVDARLGPLGRRNGRRRAGKRVTAGGGLRKSDHVPDGVRTGEPLAEPVQAEGDSAVRRRAVAKRLQQEAELCVGLHPAQSDHVEHPLLHLGPVDTDRAAADLLAVDYPALCPATRLARTPA